MTTDGYKSIFIDSSAWISYTIKPDSNHSRASEVFGKLMSKLRLIISLFILDETISKLRKVLGQQRANLFYLNLKKLEKSRKLTIYSVEREDLEKSIHLLNVYPRPNTFSLIDATNIVLCQKYKIKTLFSFDSDFKKIKVPNLRIIP